MARNKSSFKLKGMRKFMRNLNREINDLKGRTHAGLIEAAIIIFREADTMVPIDLGNLRHSFFIVSYRSRGDVSNTRNSFKGPNAGDIKSWHSRIIAQASALAKLVGTETHPVVVFGYSANYAAFVHEKIDVNFRRESARPRWLFTAMQRTKKQQLQAIRNRARFR